MNILRRFKKRNELNLLKFKSKSEKSILDLNNVEEKNKMRFVFFELDKFKNLTEPTNMIVVDIILDETPLKFPIKKQKLAFFALPFSVVEKLGTLVLKVKSHLAENPIIFYVIVGGTILTYLGEWRLKKNNIKMVETYVKIHSEAVDPEESLDPIYPTFYKYVRSRRNYRRLIRSSLSILWVLTLLLEKGRLPWLTISLTLLGFLDESNHQKDRIKSQIQWQEANPMAILTTNSEMDEDLMLLIYYGKIGQTLDSNIQIENILLPKTREKFQNAVKRVKLFKNLSLLWLGISAFHGSVSCLQTKNNKSFNSIDSKPIFFRVQEETKGPSFTLKRKNIEKNHKTFHTLKSSSEVNLTLKLDFANLSKDDLSLFEAKIRLMSKKNNAKVLFLKKDKLESISLLEGNPALSFGLTKEQIKAISLTENEKATILFHQAKEMHSFKNNSVTSEKKEEIGMEPKQKNIFGSQAKQKRKPGPRFFPRF